MRFYPNFFEKSGLLLKNILVPWEIVCYTEVVFNNFFIIGMEKLQWHKEENIMNWKRVISGVLAAAMLSALPVQLLDRKSTRLNSSHGHESRMPSSA